MHKVRQKVTQAEARRLPHIWCCVFMGLLMPQEGRSYFPGSQILELKDVQQNSLGRQSHPSLEPNTELFVKKPSWIGKERNSIHLACISFYPDFEAFSKTLVQLP